MDNEKDTVDLRTSLKRQVHTAFKQLVAALAGQVRHRLTLSQRLAKLVEWDVMYWQRTGKLLDLDVWFEGDRALDLKKTSSLTQFALLVRKNHLDLVDAGFEPVRAQQLADGDSPTEEEIEEILKISRVKELCENGY